jgi:hypothetical protein
VKLRMLVSRKDFFVLIIIVVYLVKINVSSQIYVRDLHLLTILFCVVVKEGLCGVHIV